MMKSGKTPAKDFLVIDVRDDDYAGGNIKGARNYPSREFLLNVDKLVSETKNVPVMVFHCTLSQVRCVFASYIPQDAADDAILLRGPKAARVCTISKRPIPQH